MAEALEAPLDEVGGKAASLARLHASGIPVPPFFVVGASALAGPAEHQPDESHDSGAAPVGRHPAAPLPPDVADEVVAAYHRLGHRVVAVRSSAAGEDSKAASFAGQFASLLGVSGDEALLEALGTVWASARSEEAAAYRRSRGVAAGGFAVVVQAQVFALKAGVLFTRHPLDPEGGEGYLEANFGTGESVAGGLVTPDSTTFSRAGGNVVSSAVGSKKVMTVVDETGSRVVQTPPEMRALPVLSNEEAEELVAVGMRIEELFGGPQDVEWAFDSSGMWIVQARPQTGSP